jgi:hypothetical protein
MNAAVAEMFHVEPRDKRVMNHMDGDTKLVHIRLEAWGHWSKSERLREYPQVTLLARVIEQGPMGASQSGRPPVTMPEAVAVTERAVLRCPQIDQRVLKVYYTEWAPVETMARKCSMRVKQFQNVLRRARWRVSGYIAGYEERL